MNRGIMRCGIEYEIINELQVITWKRSLKKKTKTKKKESRKFTERVKCNPDLPPNLTRFHQNSLEINNIQMDIQIPNIHKSKFSSIKQYIEEEEIKREREKMWKLP